LIINPQVPLHRLVLSLSEALDCVHSQLAKHQLRVAYIATNVGRRLGLAGQDLLDVFLGSALHDIGLVRVEHKQSVLQYGELEKVAWHGEVGCQLLHDNPLFASAAVLVRHHHTPWTLAKGLDHDGRPLPMGCHVVALADAADRFVQRDQHILRQTKAVCQAVTAQCGRELHPDCVDAFRAVAEPESFWLDSSSERVYNVLLGQMDWPTLTVDAVTLQPIAEVFGRVVDGKSPWTATHSAGVSATATALAERLSFSARELRVMRAAGFLHDLGKLTVPCDILDKPGKLSDAEWAVMKGHTYHTFRILNTIGGLHQMSEWAAFHHERLDGDGYPFRHAEDDLTLGARIMAVADTLTALTEDRPYRDGLAPERAMATLDKLVGNGALDGEIVAVLKRNYGPINAARRDAQADYGRTQAKLAQWVHAAPADLAS